MINRTCLSRTCKLNETLRIHSVVALLLCMILLLGVFRLMDIVVNLLVDGSAESEGITYVLIAVGSLSGGDDDSAVIEYTPHDGLLHHHALTLMEHEVE